MAKKPLALVVEDRSDWLDIFEQILEPKFEVEKAKTLEKATSFIKNNAKKIKFALVDLRLDEDQPNRSGVDVLFQLKPHGIPSVATTAYSDRKAIRDAFVLCKVKDVWFKDKLEVVELRDLIEKALAEPLAPPEQMRGIVGRFFWTLVGFTVVIFTILTTVVLLIPEGHVVVVIGFGIALLVLLVGSLALFINKITGEQFLEIAKGMLNLKKG